MTVRVRFAPSPTGYLHIGSARTALFNYLYARHTGGKFLLRIEDTDLARSTEESTRSILDGLAWLGFAPDEEIVFQSNNADKHREIAKRLLAEGKAYRDFTPREAPTDANVKDAIKERARLQGGDKNMRDNPYRDLSAKESDARADAGEPFAIRLKVPYEGKTSFEDAVYGQQERAYAETEDLVLLRSDGHPLYNLAVVCDDIEMAITHVIRGQDHLTNAHKQVLIYEALGVAPPIFAHLPLIMAPNKGKLSKRKHGEVVSMTTYRDAGFLAEAFRNFLALLGWSAGEEQEIYSLDELIAKFSLDGIHRSNAVFNFSADDPRKWTDDKAQWMNAEYIRTMPLESLLPFVKAELKSAKLWREEYEPEGRALTGTVSSVHSQKFEQKTEIADRPENIAIDLPEIGSYDWYVSTVDLIRSRFFTLKDFSTQGRAYFSEDFDFDPAAVAKNLTKFPNLQTWLPELADRFEAEFASSDGLEKAFTEANIEIVVKAFTEEKGTKLGVIMNGARTLLTGVAVGPSMLAVFEIIGLQKAIVRLRSRIAWN
ncbi:MAG TPA: glutamate--tRNA ligase [Pyrinomonadaceae bacterium]|nr:glutamate--tRNA ligase [Chloracidobacterium sp.]MBP9934318.1 glutamate--tRNA ligase [Pyrinomonadaceae bacterium]MBK9766454.1 glutamate--tRNA ligase [Chloracidobacterium sp.]HQX56359.1 glutamate--tRNA ligase [Pyrinomonadaceae bacterium]HQY65868.1 glutamate--tRNA ligase [Pyrinomonadaceae bacterium]